MSPRNLNRYIFDDTMRRARREPPVTIPAVNRISFTDEQRARTRVIRNNRLLDLATCERCVFNPAQYEVRTMTDCPCCESPDWAEAMRYMCEGCVAETLGAAVIREIDAGGCDAGDVGADIP